MNKINKVSLRIFICFTLVSAVIAVILLCINFVCYAYILSDSDGESPKKLLTQVSENIVHTDSGFELKKDILPQDYWCILIDGEGKVIWSCNKPEDIPESYSLNDVARFTHWFLNDYPVYVRTEDYGLFVLGLPKNAVGKYEMVYSMYWFSSLPKRILIILLINLCFAAVLSFIFGIGLYGRLRILTEGITNLRSEKHVNLPEKGIFREISANINAASDAIERKNEILAARDRARINWISGISHDIRTPLSVIMGYSEALSESDELSAESRSKAETIKCQSVKIKKLIEDLNLISSLEYDMQPSKKVVLRLCPLIRRIVTDIINSGLSENFEIELKLQDEKAAVLADESLLERAIFNLITNSIRHNSFGCKIIISEYTKSRTLHLDISDNGKGVPQNVIENITKIPKSSHGLGLPMAYRIIHVHGGVMKVQNKNGFLINIELPTE